MPSIFSDEAPQAPKAPERRPSIFDDAGPAPGVAQPTAIEPSTQSLGAPPAPPVPLRAKLLDWIKQGFGESLGNYGTVLSMGSPEATTQMMEQGQDPMTEGQKAGAGVKAEADQFTGVKGYKPEGQFEQSAKSVMGAFGDPLTYLGGGSGLVGAAGRKVAGGVASMFPEFLSPAMKAVGTAGAEVAGRAVTGGMVAAAGEGGRLAAEKAGGGPAAQFVASLLAGGAMGASAGLGGGAVDAINLGALKEGGPKVAGQLADLASDSKLRALVAAAMESDPNMVRNLEHAYADAAALNAKVPVGQQLPDNVVIRQALLAQMSRNPEFVARYGNQIDEAKTALKGLQLSRFGDPATQGSALARTTPERVTQLDRVARQAEEAFNTAIEKATRDVSANPDKADLGARLQQLLDARETWARKTYGPRIDEAVAAGEKAKARPQPAHLINLVEDARALQDRQFMSGMPAAVRRAVERTEAGAGLDLGLKDLMHMDQAVGKALRETSTASPQYLKLRNLQQSIDDAIAGSGDAFSAPYRAAQADYRNAVAIPFLQADGVKAMTRAKFEEQVVPLLMRKSVAGDFLRAGGEDAPGLLRESVLSDFYKRAVAPKGSLDPEAARKWMDANGPVVDMVPGLRASLENPTEAARVALGNKAAVAQRMGEALKHRIYSAEGKGELQTANELLSNSVNVDKFLHTYGRNADSIYAGRSIVIDRILKETDPVAAIQDNPAWKNSVERLFGKDYMESLNDLARLKANWNKAEAVRSPMNLEHVAKDPLQQWGGQAFSIPHVAGVLRNQVMNPMRKAFQIGSTGYFGRAGKELDNKIQAMLLEPDILRAHVRALQEAGPKGGPEEYLKSFLRSERVSSRLADLTASVMTGAGRGAAIGAVHSGSTKEAPEDQPFPKTMWDN